jgi:hypothetical protein
MQATVLPQKKLTPKRVNNVFTHKETKSVF